MLDVEQLRGWDRLGHLHYLALCQVVAARAPADAASSQLASADAAAADAAAASSSASSAAGEGHWWSDGIAQLGELRGFSLSGAYDYVYGDYPWSSGGRSKCKLSVAQVGWRRGLVPALRVSLDGPVCTVLAVHLRCHQHVLQREPATPDITLSL